MVNSTRHARHSHWAWIDVSPGHLQIDSISLTLSLSLFRLLTIDLSACAAYLLIHVFIRTRRIQCLPYAHRCLVKMAGSALWYM